MPDHAANLSEMKVVRFDVSWKGDKLGLVEDVDLSNLQERWLDKKNGELGDVLLDRAFLGLEGTIRFTLTQISTALIRKITAEAGATGAFSLSPTTPLLGKYALAGVLNLHPIGVVGTDDDINIVKAYPTFRLGGGNRATAAWEKITVECDIFPDQAQLLADPPKLVYWYRGAIPV